MTIQDYLNLIPSANSEQPNFLATLSLVIAPCVQVQNLYTETLALFDLDTPPVGNQLDIIGQWVGVSRNIAVPISGVYFTWDGAADLGWDYGTWQPAAQPTQITSLPDDAYYTLILGKIAANNWDGTTNGAYKIWNALFTGFTILIQDYQNMSYALIIVGSVIDSLTLALITGGYIPLRPEGVEVVNYYTSPGPVFAWDVAPTSLLAGWDTGLWAANITP